CVCCEKYLSNHIRVYRAENQMTQQDLAEKVGVSRQTIISTEKGKYTPSLILGFKIANVFGVGIDHIFEYKDIEEDVKVVSCLYYVFYYMYCYFLYLLFLV